MHASILSFGRALPSQKIKAETIAEHWKRGMDQASALGIKEKTVASSDQNTFTLASDAAEQALGDGIDRQKIGAVFVGSESHPYAVKPTSGILVTALNINPYCHAADLEFACKAGTAAMQIVKAMSESKQITMGLAIGADTAQSKPGDALEYSAAAGAAAFVIGMPNKKNPGICTMDTTLSYTTDTPDFWRGNQEKYPSHAGRFTGEPAYFHHIEAAAKAMLATSDLRPEDFDHVVLHMPNAKFPMVAAQSLGFTKEQLTLGFIVPIIGNTYSACSPLGLTFVLEHAKKDDRILLVSYGSGAGADAFIFTMQQDGVPLSSTVETPTYMEYGEYRRAQEAISH
jgi:hydroxymethylglutaryl-CoA synthase